MPEPLVAADYLQQQKESDDDVDDEAEMRCHKVIQGKKEEGWTRIIVNQRQDW